MSVAAQKLVRKHSPAKPASVKQVLGELAFAGDDGGRGARLSHKQLVKATGLSRNTVQRALAKLEAEQLIVRHLGDATHCGSCRRAQRGVVVYDVVLPPDPVADANPDQLGLLTSPTDQPHDQPHLGPVANRHQPRGGAGTSPMVGLLEEKEDSEGQQQLGNAREISSEQTQAVERIVSALSPTRLFVDRYAIEGVAIRYRPEQLDEALVTVVALAGDPTYRLPKGGAAKMLLIELQRMSSSAGAQPAFPPRPSRFTKPAPAVDDRFAKYDVAAAVAS